MQVRTVRKPGDRGTQKLVETYGARLVCVRYRYDSEKHKRYNTIELIIAEESWIPEPLARVDDSPAAVKHRDTPRVPVRIRYHEKDLQRQIKAIDGTWEREKKLWYAPEEYIRRLGLEKRIVR